MSHPSRKRIPQTSQDRFKKLLRLEQLEERALMAVVSWWSADNIAIGLEIAYSCANSRDSAVNRVRPHWLKTMDCAFATAWMFILLVSVIDGYLVWYCRDVIEHFERNPAGQALMSLSGGNVGLFLFVKS